MKMIAWAMILGLFSSCASSYRPVLPAKLQFQSSEQTNGMTYSYQYDVLRNAGNKKYAKKEFKKSVRVIAVKIENTTDRTINFRNDVQIYKGDRLISPMDPKLVGHTLRQSAPLYLLWGLLWLNISDCENNDCSVTPIPLGLGIGLINVSVASTANKRFYEELYAFDILDKNIAPGETAYGLIGISADSMDQLSFRIGK